MTDADKRTFAHAFARLAIALREQAPDALQQRVYFAGLTAHEIEFVVAAAERLTAEAQWFPKVSEWRAVASKIETERVEAQRALLRRLPAPLCAVCDDTGWSRDANDRVSRCDCQPVRRLEVLGRQPWPALPEATRADNSGATIGRDEAAALTSTILRRSGPHAARDGGSA